MSTFEALDIINKIQSDSAFNTANNLTQNRAAQQAWLDTIKANSDFFFDLMRRLLEGSREAANFEAQLQRAAEQCGFADLNEALNRAINRDGQSPLQYAFQTQDFALAKRLMSSGAIAGPIERAAFEIALDSKAARKFGFTASSEEEKLHPVKNYGLILGIQMTSQDGTSSQFGHIAPTYQLMTNAVDVYAKKNSNNKDFQAISEAMRFSNKTAAFINSTSQRIPEAGKEIASRIQRGELTTIPISCEGHAMGLSIVPDGPHSKSGYLVYTNRGVGATQGKQGTQIYRIDDLNKVTPTFINSMMNGHSNGIPYANIMSQVSQVTGEKPPVYALDQKAQKVDNCTIANSKSNLHGILLCQKAISKNGFDNLEDHDVASVKSEYKKFTSNMRDDKVKELVADLKKHPNSQDLTVLAQEYLAKKPKAAAALREPLDKALGITASSNSVTLGTAPDTKSITIKPVNDASVISSSNLTSVDHSETSTKTYKP